MTSIPLATRVRLGGRNEKRRRHIQWAFLAVFILLPLFDLFRFDFTAGRLHLFGAEIWLDEWAILWLALMASMWLIGTLSLLFGRVYCAYACPQTVFSELAHDLDTLAKRLTRRVSPQRRPLALRAISLTGIAVLSVAAAVFFLAYFAPLPAVVSRLVHFDFTLWVGAIGAFTALVAFLDFVLVRESFCHTACPYGLLQGVIEDGKSLHVKFEEKGCIECNACARVCPMDIDIRNGPFQIECTRCGSCIDACDTVLGKLNRPGLLSFEWPKASALKAFDAKRILVTVATVGFVVALGLAVATRHMVAVKLSPVYAESGASNSAIAESSFLLRVANRGRKPVVLGIRPEGLPASARIYGLADTTVPAGRERRFNITVHVPIADTQSSVTPFVWIVETPEGAQRFAASIFARRRTP